MSIPNLTYLIYTHTEYIDVLDLTLKRLKKYFPIEVSICSDNARIISDTYKQNYSIKDIYEYDDTQVYGSKLLSVIEKIQTEYILFNHDVNILYDYVNKDIINTILKRMETNNIDTVRLSTSGVEKKRINETDLLHEILPGETYFMTVQPTIWRRDTLLKFCKKFSNIVYRDFELGETQKYASTLKNYYIHTKKDQHITCNYYLSEYYPCMHSIYRGKWNIIQNPKEIHDLAEEYSLNLHIRGLQYWE